MSQRDDATCATCAFWMLLASRGGIPGECRRDAPAVVVLGSLEVLRIPPDDDDAREATYSIKAAPDASMERAERVFPETNSSDWCGEWVARGEPGDPRRSVGYVEGTGSRPRVELVSGWRPLVGRFLSPGSILQHRDGSRVQLLRRKDDDSGWWLAPPDGGLDDRMIRKTGEWFLVSVIDTPPPPPEQTSQRSTEP